MRTRLCVAAIGCALGLAGCASMPVQPAVVSVPLPPARPPSKADVAVAKASAELVRYCSLTAGALAAVDLFASPKVHAAVDRAEAVVATVCAAPPTDVRSALDTVARAYTAVITASAAE